MSYFMPTHEILITRNGVLRRIPVRLHDPEDGVLYTQEEWDADASADWVVDEGRVLFQGQVPVCDSYLLIALSHGGAL